MFEEKLKDFLEISKFTTAKIQKNFLPRRIGLGYDFKHENIEMDLIKDIRLKQNKNRKIVIENKEESEEEELSKSKMVK